MIIDDMEIIDEDNIPEIKTETNPEFEKIQELVESLEPGKVIELPVYKERAQYIRSMVNYRFKNMKVRQRKINNIQTNIYISHGN